MRILDPTCSTKSIWFDKNNPHVVHCDKRVGDYSEACSSYKGRNLVISPHVQLDFTALPFCDECFDMVVFDPPHYERLGNTSALAIRYGKLFPGWEDDIHAGFDECWRVLKTNGTLIFKWSVTDIPLKKVLELAPPPLFGHTTGSNSQTRWITFVKFPIAPQ